ncbi:MAG: GLPGLI family protein [Muribaculaceae bacterium]|nr:GLPGLI family protein [Muribaculaceae bacterium]
MKKIFIIITIICIFATLTSSGVKRRTLHIAQNSVPETETIADETMEFVYDYRCCIDTTGSLEDNFTSDDMLLQIGPDGLSKFSCYKNLTVDSIILRTSDDQLYKAASEGKLNNGEFMTIFKNYPSGKLTHTEKICMDWFRYEEDMPKLEWELTDSVTNVLGYECQSAKCSFRGREWTAFYTEDIPLTEGPWKLYGLPGLIMKASDENGHYTFECIGIKSKANRPITIYKVPFNKVSRKEYYDTKHRYEINPYAYTEATAGIHITVHDEAGNPALDAYDPMDLSYDYLEPDWRK